MGTVGLEPAARYLRLPVVDGRRCRIVIALRRAIDDTGNAIFVGAASAWEIAARGRIGKLSGVAAIAADLAAVLASQGFLSLPISFLHGQAAGALPGPHKDPFDRMLIALAMLEGMALVSNETHFDAYRVRRLW